MAAHRVLIVDDNVEFCQNVADILELHGYETGIAQNGAEALACVTSNKPDLVLMDVRMPVINGVDAFKRIKELSPATPVIMMTAYAVEDLLRESLREGAFGCLRKPLDFTKLLKLIENSLQRGGLILVVDDNAALCANIQDILGVQGYVVSVAADGENALQMARESRFDVILLDMKLPPLNGLETYLAMRGIRPQVVVVLITGCLSEMGTLIEEALHRSAYACIEKPIDIDALLSLLQQIRDQVSKGALQKPGQVPLA